MIILFYDSPRLAELTIKYELFYLYFVVFLLGTISSVKMVWNDIYCEKRIKKYLSSCFLLTLYKVNVFQIIFESFVLASVQWHYKTNYFYLGKDNLHNICCCLLFSKKRINGFLYIKINICLCILGKVSHR